MILSLMERLDFVAILEEATTRNKIDAGGAVQSRIASTRDVTYDILNTQAVKFQQQRKAFKKKSNNNKKKSQISYS